MLFKQTSGVGLSQDMLEKKLKEHEGKPAALIKNSQLEFGTLKDLNNVQSLVCSTNYEFDQAKDYIELECTSTMISHIQLRSLNIGDTVQILCPAFCADASSPIYGDFS